ncbi:Ger(x)C family spore germination protein [Paenibacillus sp. XY044]|uniref:Ger(x)C family spore germination protein n=1 Tax=Paenibacillus sp. XY044 TaxID=2026089 RepID=UPI000B97D324|nr:Ger(x)C family spore germination protein [Paenibacillus sp. XY044]OZB91279.1 hypothetical protein CJP46_28720 [Paenibacillus sp. XY044]
MNKRWSGLLLTLAVLTGCGDQHILERTGFCHTISYDLLPDHNFKIGLSVPKADPNSKTDREVLQAIAHSSKDSQPKLVRQTSLLLVNGQLRNLLFSLPLAENGLLNQMDTLSRDPSIPPKVKITLADGDAYELLKKNYKEHPRTDRYIYTLLDKEASYQTVPEATLYEFIRDYYDDGIDPIAPIIKDAGDTIAVSGVGLFRGDRYITRIKPDDLHILALLRHNLRHADMTIHLVAEGKHKELLTFTSLKSNRTVDIVHDKQGKPVVMINIKASGSVLEYIGKLKLHNDEDRNRLLQQAARHVERRAEEMIKFMQDNKVDSIGIGAYVRNSMSYPAWKKLDWYEEYSHLTVKCNVDLKIINSGQTL